MRCATRLGERRASCPSPAPAMTSTGPSVVEHGLPLGGIEVGEVLLGLQLDGGGRHAADASRAVANAARQTRAGASGRPRRPRRGRRRATRRRQQSRVPRSPPALRPRATPATSQDAAEPTRRRPPRPRARARRGRARAPSRASTPPPPATPAAGPEAACSRECRRAAPTKARVVPTRISDSRRMRRGCSMAATCCARRSGSPNAVTASGSHAMWSAASARKRRRRRAVTRCLRSARSSSSR